jgi:hypothetical protein
MRHIPANFALAPTASARARALRAARSGPARKAVLAMLPLYLLVAAAAAALTTHWAPVMGAWPLLILLALPLLHLIPPRE